MPDLQWPTPPDPEPPPGDVARLGAVRGRARELRRRRRGIAAGAAVTAALVVAVGVVVVDRDQPGEQRVITAPTTTTLTTPTTLDAAPPVRYPPAPVDCPGSLVDTTNAGLVQARAPGPAFGEADYPRQYVAHWTVDEQTIELHVPATAVRDLVGERTEPVALGAGEGTVWFRPDSVQVRGPTGLTDPLMCDSFDVTVSGPDEADNRELGINVATGLAFGPQLDDGHGAAVDYVNAVTHDGTTYISQRPADLAGTDLGDALFEVETTDSMQEPAAGFGQREGEATYLTRGTRVYAVDGFDPRFRLAAEHDGVLALFEADSVPTATMGADLFDLDGETKVVRISINSELDGTTELASIDDPAIVQQMVDDVLAAPVDQTQQPTTEQRYFIAFHFAGAPPVIRAYWPQERLLHRGILVPPSFQEHVAAAYP